LQAFFSPRSAFWSYDDANKGQRKDYAIINETGLLGVRVLRAGMLTGLSNQTSPWFRLGADIPEIDDQTDVRVWFEEVERRVREVFLKSNTYQTLLTSYGEEGLYGTTAFLVLEDDATVIRCHPYPIGSFYLMMDDTLRVDGCMRILTMTVRQMVERFGYDNVSESMQVLYDSNAGGMKETSYPVVSVIHKGSYFGSPKEGGMKPPMPWVSTWYELSSWNSQKGILRKSGFMESPLIAGRWSVVGENVYGESPAMDCLGSTMSLQAWEERLAQAAEKQFNPPMVASSSIDPRKLTTLPGDISFVDDDKAVFRSAYDVQFRLEGGLQQIQRIEGRINDAMYRSLFQMFSESDRREITAEEIRARMQEKMQVLGPVVERNVEEILAPLVRRTISIMQRKNLLPPMPKAMQGRLVKIEFVSILAKAAKIGRLNSISQFMTFVGSEAAVNQGVFDLVDLDDLTRQFAKDSDLPPTSLRSEEAVAQIRADRDQQQKQAQAADNAQKLAAAAGNLANAKTGTGSLLDQALPALANGG
jgi:hypothetical protein